jgi:hypothetical protein
MTLVWARLALFTLGSAVACAPTTHSVSPANVAPQATTSATVASAPPAASSAAPTVASSAKPTPVPPHPCGAFDCLAFATPGAAFDYVLQSNPRVLAVGEAHAQDNTPGIRSSTRRFAEQLLPKLAGKAKHIVIELLLANCKQETVQGVKEQQAPVTEHQAKTNQNEFVTLGKVAQSFGIEPSGLTPDCPEYEAVVAAGQDAIPGLLRLVADQTTKEVEALLAKPDASADLILTYGGALHNDLYPRPGQEAWSFGPKLAADTQNRYVELDLIVPEFVKDTEAWRNLPWFAAFDREHLNGETLLYRPAPGSFALIFPKTERAVPQQL